MKTNANHEMLHILGIVGPTPAFSVNHAGPSILCGNKTPKNSHPYGQDDVGLDTCLLLSLNAHLNASHTSRLGSFVCKVVCHISVPIVRL